MTFESGNSPVLEVLASRKVKLSMTGPRECVASAKLAFVASIKETVPLRAGMAARLPKAATVEVKE